MATLSLQLLRMVAVLAANGIRKRSLVPGLLREVLFRFP